jgi:uncharacterized protein YcbK (DUF882 family)
MKASKIRPPLPLWLVPCVCLPLLVLYPGKAEPTPHAAAISVAMVGAQPSIAVLELPEPSPAPATVHVVLTRGHKRLELELPIDGNVPATTADAIARMMRDPISGRTRRIAAGTLALLADVAVRFPGHEIEVVSAVRDEPDRTRDGVKHSKHWDGHAIDIKLSGVKLADVRDAMWKNHRDIGVGWYPEGGFIHVDYRPDAHDTAWTQPRRNADNHYNPGWARVAPNANDDADAWHATMQVLLGTGATLSTLVPSIIR